MKIKKFIAVLLVLTVTVVMFTSCGGKTQSNTDLSETTKTTDEQNAKNKTVVVITEGENSGFWDNVEKGATESARKHGYTVLFRRTENSTDKETIKELISTVVDEKPAGIVLSVKEEGLTEVLSKTYDNNIPVVQFENGVNENDLTELERINKNPVHATVFSAEKDAGSIAAQRMYNAVKGDIEKSDGKYRVTIMSENDTNQITLRAVGFYEKFSELADADDKTKGKYEVAVETVNADSDSIENGLAKKVNAVFFTSENLANAVSDVVSREYEKFKDIIFCGFDSGIKQLEWLKAENSAFIGAVARNGYEMGYNAVEQCVFSAEGKDVKEKTEISAEWYDVTNYEKMLQSNFVYN